MAKKAKVEKDTSERWLLTYADLMNLLLIFFIILYAMSKVDQTKYEEFANSMSHAFLTGKGVMPFSQKDMIIDQPFITPKSKEEASDQELKDSGGVEKKVMEAFKHKVENIVKTLGLQGVVTVMDQERGIQISIPSHVLFRPGSDEIESIAMTDLERIGRLLNEIPDKQIRIEGHTDSDPISTTQFPSNWELSAARAVKVLRLLVSRTSISPDRIAATGYGEMWSIAPNDTPDNKAKNRRVDIVILRNLYNQASPDKIATNESDVSHGSNEISN